MYSIFISAVANSDEIGGEYRMNNQISQMCFCDLITTQSCWTFIINLEELSSQMKAWTRPIMFSEVCVKWLFDAAQ